MLNIESDIPDDNEGIYEVPSSDVLDDFVTIIDDILNENFGDANTLAANYDYEVIEYNDTNNSLTYYILLEDNPISRGWGTYVFNLNNTHEHIIEAPHPKFEPYTCDIAIELFVNLGARAKGYLMAGTHRYTLYQNGYYVSDITRSFDNIFEKVHEALVSSNSKTLSIHNFSIFNHPGYPNIVLSNGNPPPAAGDEEDEFNAIENTLENNYSTTVGICDGANYNDLSGGVNRQGQYVRNNNMGYFYHWEIEAFNCVMAGNRQDIIDGMTDHYTNY